MNAFFDKASYVFMWLFSIFIMPIYIFNAVMSPSIHSIIGTYFVITMVAIFFDILSIKKMVLLNMCLGIKSGILIFITLLLWPISILVFRRGLRVISYIEANIQLVQTDKKCGECGGETETLLHKKPHSHTITRCKECKDYTFEDKEV